MSHSDDSEKYAFEVIRRAVGLVVTPYDDGSKPRMVDGVFDRDDGTSGAVEVVRIASPEVMQAEKLMFGDEWRVDGATGGWWVNVDGARVRLDTLRAYLPALVLESESEGVASPHLCTALQGSDELQWVVDNNVWIRNVGETNRPGVVYVAPHPEGGAVDTELAGLVPWLDNTLRSDSTAVSHVDKLLASGRDELHLFLGVHASSLPASLQVALGWEEVVPQLELTPPEGIFAVWLKPQYGPHLLWWTASEGWSIADVSDGRGDS